MAICYFYCNWAVSTETCETQVRQHLHHPQNSPMSTSSAPQTKQHLGQDDVDPPHQPTRQNYPTRPTWSTSKRGKTSTTGQQKETNCSSDCSNNTNLVPRVTMFERPSHSVPTTGKHTPINFHDRTRRIKVCSDQYLSRRVRPRHHRKQTTFRAFLVAKTYTRSDQRRTRIFYGNYRVTLVQCQTIPSAWGISLRYHLQAKSSKLADCPNQDRAKP